LTGIFQLLNNEIVRISIFSWFIAQTLKVALVLVKEKKLDFSRMIGSGGMPSSHSALVTAMTTSLGIKTGWTSPITGMATLVALIVMYDAAGVRRAAGEQAELLNKIVNEIYQGKFKEERLKELIGHTPKEVFAGAILGLVIAFLIA
jgi:hypothetical protein